MNFAANPAWAATCAAEEASWSKHEMTDIDIDISKALALAIGWPANRMQHMINSRGISHICCLTVPNCIPLSFDYRDWNVAGPIAERYDMFPWLSCGEWTCNEWVFADTPQKAIALAVIGAKK